jgi:diketogulonate reductase-like aldo/keto reductase
MYAAGHSEELLGQALHAAAIPRDQVFLTSKVSAEHLRQADVHAACERSLRRLNVEYLDLYLIHWPNPQVPLSETIRALNELIREGRVRHIGVSNFDLMLLKEAWQLSSAPIFADQVPFSLRDRSYSKNGVLDFCQQNDILLTAYTPFEQGGLRIDPHLQSIARAHGARPHQIALAWLLAQPRIITIPMSSDAGHQRENLAAADIQLGSAEIARLN